MALSIRMRTTRRTGLSYCSDVDISVILMANRRASMAYVRQLSAPRPKVPRPLLRATASRLLSTTDKVGSVFLPSAPAALKFRRPADNPHNVISVKRYIESTHEELRRSALASYGIAGVAFAAGRAKACPPLSASAPGRF